MALRTIALNGFKSFATDTKIHLYHPVTAIVGPNGSGKSNVADAIRFALGEQSMKSMRGGKGEDLIFNGSHKVGRKNRAHVSLLFDNSGRIFDYDASEIELERLVHRDGVNEYVVNNNKVRLKDKMELIASANIGPTGHHLITQGEADKFVTATAVERRLLIEDALGLNLFKLRRKEAQQKLEKTDEKLKEVSKLVWELEPVVKALSDEVGRLQSLKQKESTLAKMYAEMFYLWNRWLSEEGLRLENLLADFAAEKDNLSTEIGQLEAQTSENQVLTDEEVQLGVRKTKLQRELTDIQQSIGENNNQLGSISGELKQLQLQLDAMTSVAPKISSVAIAIESIDELHNSVQSAVSLLGAKQAEEKFYHICIGDSRIVDSGQDKKIQTLKSSIDELKIKKQEKDIKLRSLTAEVEKIQNTLQSVEQDIRRAGSDRLQSVKLLEQKRARYQEVIAKSSDTKNKLDELVADRKNFTARKQKATSLYGTKALEDYTVSMTAGESVEGRLRDTKRQVLRLEAQLEDVDISSLPSLVVDMETEAARLTHLQTEKHDVETSMVRTRELVVELTNQIETKIEVGLAEVNKNLERFFRVLFGGGGAVLRSTKDGDKRGVEIDLQLPYKRIKSVYALSGGERSLASLAILFAITLLSPPPFVVLDETDAALDEANSRRYAKLIRELSEHTQLVLITHNRETMTFADELYGVTMGSDGVSRLLSVTLREAESAVKN